MGPDAAQIVHRCCNMSFDDPSTEPHAILDALQTHYRAEKSIFIDKSAFKKRKQRDGETFDEFQVRPRRTVRRRRQLQALSRAHHGYKHHRWCEGLKVRGGALQRRRQAYIQAGHRDLQSKRDVDAEPKRHSRQRGHTQGQRRSEQGKKPIPQETAISPEAGPDNQTKAMVASARDQITAGGSPSRGSGCFNCGGQHDYGKCPARNKNCKNCGKAWSLPGHVPVSKHQAHAIGDNRSSLE